MPTTRIGIVQHTDDCPPALLGEWLVEAGAELVVRRPATGDALPELDGAGAVDAVVVLGGPMGAYDDAAHPWLADTKQLIRDAAAGGVPVLGVCLGHQLAAVALGGRAVVSPRGQQLGVLPIGWTPAAEGDDLVGALAGSRIGVHWNHDVVTDLPPGAEVLACAPGGEVQAARFAPTVWGVQWHPEVDGSVLSVWADQDRAEHEALGIDQAALLGEIDEVQPDLDAAWRPLAAALVRRAAACNSELHHLEPRSNAAPVSATRSYKRTGAAP